jgi:hypothetical protein
MKLTTFVRLELKSMSVFMGKKTFIWGAVAVILMFLMEFTLKMPIPIYSMMFFVSFAYFVNSLPFMLEIKNDMYTFFITQNIPRDTVVYGRYLYALLTNAISMGAAFLFQVIVIIASDEPAFYVVKILISLILCISFFVMLCMSVAVNFPLNFKFGYARSQGISSLIPLVFVFIPMLTLVVLFLQKKIVISQDIDIGIVLIALAVSALLSIVVPPLLAYISIRLSRRFFFKRDL